MPKNSYIQSNHTIHLKANPPTFQLHLTDSCYFSYSDHNQQSDFSYIGNGSIITVSTDSPVVQLSFPSISLGTQPSCLLLFPLLDSASSPPLMTNTCKTSNRACADYDIHGYTLCIFNCAQNKYLPIPRPCGNVET